jgi:transcription elongation factor GreA
MKKEDFFELTAEGYLELETELNELKNVKRVEIINALKEARANGDLSENADYDAARNDQAQTEARIKELEYKLEHSKIADNKSKAGVAGIGSMVTVQDEDGDEEEYKLVSSVEADPFNNKISVESPIGVAIKGHKIGDTVTVESPNGGYNIKILKVA